ncbi:ARM REPEAT PROTEIN INTERACTING WITH like [Actinidia chinensis var. chinensis]|uniref:ARM REPEAT PROTEIN INTERACTING WITH like n=1 Tax=Actinidia chinensis var. chinensis TaxID=1590841 RepID=A0A2R6QGL1_ACTCC|nr:ARM REPEAT PROTEIN INTERACTING WITH like [Actinidia chinensis var. chinensis]
MAEEVKTIQEELSYLILLSDRVIKSALEAESSKAECGELANQADRLAHKLRSTARLAAQPIYDRPLRRVAADVRKNLERAITLARKCRHSGILRQVFAIAATADFRRVGALLESSIADVTWILSIFDSDGGANLSLPPIASNDPILAMLWSSIASVQIGQLRDRVDAANNLASLARDNDRNKKMIVEEGGIVPLLKLLKEGACPEAQIAAALALSSLGNDQDRVQLIAGELAVPIVVKVLGDSPARVQVAVANLVAKMAEMDPIVQDELGRENVTRPLVTLLGFDTVLDDPKLQSGKTSIHSLVQIARDPVTNIHNSSSSSSLHSDGSSRGGNHKKERGIESPELKLELKISCAKALWKLSRGSLLNSKKITETKGLLCLAKLIEKERGELQRNCLMTVMELAAVAETNVDLRRVSFKPNSSAAKAVLEQLLRVVNEENSPALLIPAIKSIGCLARTFPAKESRIIGPLVSRLGHRDADVSSEAVISLGKFACPDNFNHVEHSKAIIEFDGVPRLMNLLKISGQDQVNELVLLCYLALHVGNNKAFEQVRARDVLEGAARSVVAQHPDLRELFAKAVHHLTLYQVGAHTHRQAYAP